MAKQPRLLEEFSEVEIEQQIEDERREVEYDTAEFTAEIVAKKLSDRDIYIPEYQRPLIWPDQAKANFIESLIIGIPIPYIFCCDTASGRLEVIDGSQRLRTIAEFLSDGFPLRDLEKLNKLEGLRFSDLPASQRRKLNNRPIRMIILNQKAAENVKFDIFHRLNSGGTRLTDSQIRKGAFPGRFYRLVIACAAKQAFINLCPFSKRKDASGEREELVLRFLTYSEKYTDFSHDVAAFLNEFIESKQQINNAELAAFEARFDRMINFVNDRFPYGFFKGPRSKEVPRVRFESLSVGTHLALEVNPNLVPGNFDWLDSQDFAALVRTDASNSGPKLRARIEFVRDSLLG